MLRVLESSLEHDSARFERFDLERTRRALDGVEIDGDAVKEMNQWLWLKGKKKVKWIWIKAKNNPMYSIPLALLNVYLNWK